MKRLVPTAAALLLEGAATPAAGTIVYANDFDGEDGGLSAPAYDRFAGLFVAFPSVDLVSTGDDNGIAWRRRHRRVRGPWPVGPGRPVAGPERRHA